MSSKSLGLSKSMEKNAHPRDLVIHIEENNFNSTVSEGCNSVKMGFIRKIYFILLSQLVLICTLNCITLFIPIVRFYIQENFWLLIIGCFLYGISLIFLLMKLQDYPMNCLVLLFLTCAEAYSIGVAAAYYDQPMLLYMFILIFCSVLTWVVHTYQRKMKFNFQVFGVFICAYIMILAKLLQVLFMSAYDEMMLSAGCGIIVCWYILFNTNKIMHKTKASDFLIGAIYLHTDTVMYPLQFVHSFLKT